MDVERTPAHRTAEVESTKTMIERVEEQFDIIKPDGLRLRGMTGAYDEFTLAAAVQNLRRLTKLASQGPPTKG